MLIIDKNLIALVKFIEGTQKRMLQFKEKVEKLRNNNSFAEVSTHKSIKNVNGYVLTLSIKFIFTKTQQESIITKDLLAISLLYTNTIRVLTK